MENDAQQCFSQDIKGEEERRRTGGGLMTVEVRLVERIEDASVNAERRTTLAVGALLLHWGQFDSSLGAMIELMRKKHGSLGLGGLPEEHPGDHGGRLKLLRKFIKACPSAT
jgi:hypothetical protein